MSINLDPTNDNNLYFLKKEFLMGSNHHENHATPVPEQYVHFQLDENRFN